MAPTSAPVFLVWVRMDVTQGRCALLSEGQDLWVGWDPSRLSSLIASYRPARWLRLFLKQKQLYVELLESNALRLTHNQEALVPNRPTPLHDGSMLSCKDWSLQINKPTHERQLLRWLEQSNRSTEATAFILKHWMLRVTRESLYREKGLAPEQKLAYEERLLKMQQDLGLESELLFASSPREQALLLESSHQTSHGGWVSVPFSRKCLDFLFDLAQTPMLTPSKLLQFQRCACWLALHCERLYGSMQCEHKRSPKERRVASFTEAFAQERPSLLQRARNWLGAPKLKPSPPLRSNKATFQGSKLTDESWQTLAPQEYSWQFAQLERTVSLVEERFSDIQAQMEDAIFDTL